MRLVAEAGGLEAAGRVQEALERYDAALALDPSNAIAWFNAGGCVHRLGRLDEAIERYRRALELTPEFAIGHNSIGTAQAGLGRIEEAAASFARATAADPLLAVAHGNLGNAMNSLGRPERAIQSYRRALEIDPSSALTHFNMGVCMVGLARYEDAIESYALAIERNPSYADAFYNLGNANVRLGRLSDAEKAFTRAIEITPQFARAHTNLGTVLAERGRSEEAAACHRQAVQLDPRLAQAHLNLGTALYQSGNLDEAAAAYRRAIEIEPNLASAHTALLFLLSHSDAITPEELAAEHRRFGTQFEPSLRREAHTNSRDPERIIRVGIVSADLRDNAIAYFAEPLFANLASRKGLSLHAYYNFSSEDPVTHRFKDYFTQWTPVFTFSDSMLAETIRRDEIDILIDLSGHTGGNRLLTFARKPAPVQASWMGYPGTTGLGAMDYYLADPQFLPFDEFASQFTEKLVHLPANAPFLPFETAPAVNALPASVRGHVTFGSFNRLSKVRRSTVALWSQLLRALPHARMIIGGMPEHGGEEQLVAWFDGEGIDRERLTFHARSDLDTYLRLHQDVDICLDTIPYTGGTTTAHALWMGVPTLSIAGHTPAARQGAALLARAGLDNFIATDPQDFVHRGVDLATDLAALGGTRSGLRDRCRASKAHDPKVIADGVERALRTMWQRWCEGLPAASFDTGSVLPRPN